MCLESIDTSAFNEFEFYEFFLFNFVDSVEAYFVDFTLVFAVGKD